jgi:tyrosine-protein kinase Etk/Wzc
MIPKGTSPKGGDGICRRLRDVKYYETIFDILARQFEVAKLDEAKEGAVIQVVDPAIVPDRKSFPRRGIFSVIGALLGLFIGVSTCLVQAGVRRLKDDPKFDLKLSHLRKAFFA